MTMLELRAVDLDDGAGIAEQCFGRCLYQSSLAGTRGPQQKEVCEGTTRRRKTCQINLVNPRQLTNGTVLSYDSSAQASRGNLRMPAVGTLPG